MDGEKRDPRAGKPAEASDLVNVPRLVTAYYTGHPDPTVPTERVAFGTSGHRGSAFTNSFNEAHILAITQAICEYRRRQGTDGPLYLAMDTHALAEPAFATALEVLAAQGVEVMIDQERAYTPTPALSHAILAYNRGRKSAWPMESSLRPPTTLPTTAGSSTTLPTAGRPTRPLPAGSRTAPTLCSPDARSDIRAVLSTAPCAPPPPTGTIISPSMLTILATSSIWTPFAAPD